MATLVDTTAAVNAHYSSLALSPATETSKSYSENVALSFGYSAEELAAIPEGANLGVSCGNPLALAGIRPGEIVVDLGSGAGFDVFLAAKKAGPGGMAIGVDVSKDMLARARLNASKSFISNVKFVESPISSIDLPSSSADCIISNCVINLVPALEKHLVFKEIFRLLKPGGRVAVSDILAKKDLPLELQKNIALYVGCISGASMVAEYEKWLTDAGFEDVMILDKHNDLNIYKDDTRSAINEKEAPASCCSSKESQSAELVDMMRPTCCDSNQSPPKPAVHQPEVGGCGGTTNVKSGGTPNKVTGIDFNEWVGSFSVYALKPATI